MSTFNVAEFEDFFSKMCNEEPATDPLKGPFNTMTKIKKALDALNVMKLEDPSFLDLPFIQSKYTEIYISLGKINADMLGDDRFELVSQAGENLRDILELQKGLQNLE